MHIAKLLPRFHQLDRVLQSFEQRENWSASDLQNYQLERLNKIWAVARTSVPHYVKQSHELGLPDRFGSLQEYSQRMPLLKKSMVRDTPQEMISSNRQPGRWHRTGGSTGIPTAVYWEHRAHQEMQRAKYRGEQSHGLDVFDRKVFLWGHSGSFAPGWGGFLQCRIRPIQDRLRNRLRVSAYDLSAETMKNNLKRISNFRPRSIYGYSSAVDLLAGIASRDEIMIPDLCVAILTAEPADSRMLERVGKRLGCTAVTEYGSVECGLIAYSMPDRTLRTRDDLVFVETIPAETGTHDIVVTVLNNPSFPLLRYCIGDSTSKALQRPERGLGILDDIQGRSNDTLLSKSGKRLHSMAVKHMLEHWPQIQRFTAHQSRGGDLNVTIEASSQISESLIRSLQLRLENMLEGYSVEMTIVDQIPGNLAGKHRWIVSDIENRPSTDSDA